MRISPALLVVTGYAFGLSASASWAKGLDQLSEQAPEEGADSGGDKPAHADADAEGAASGVAAQVTAPSEASKAVSQKLFLATSAGWVRASKKSGSWKSSGMTDLTIGYRILSLSDKSAVAGTYRYAPMAVSGTEDSRSYRGVWEAHDFGGRFNYFATPSIDVVATGELGIIAAHLNSVDGLPIDSSVDKAGGALTLGGGADFALSDKGAFSVGPRLYLGVGSVNSVQLAGAASFLF